MNRRRRLIALALAVALGSAAAPTAAPAIAQTPPASPGAVDVEAAFRAMSPEDRVGQLFLVAIYEPDPDKATPIGSDVRSLITEARIGGVVLQVSSLAFSNERRADAPAQVREVTYALQAHSLGPEGPGVPLFVAVDHEGDGAPRTHLRQGFTTLPSAMAIGATWDTDKAEAIGAIVGEELASAGINLLLGPVLDVLAEPRATQRGDIGVRAFGGDPFWVGRMGQSYIRGLHRGSLGRVAAVAKHFPGHGGSDRLPDTEVATVSKSLQELQRIELPPFRAVTSGLPGSDPGVADGLMTSHIRYRGFQGNIRDTTPPISLDDRNLPDLLALPGFTEWREGGGLVVADSLGVQAIRKYDDPSLATFNHRGIARAAFRAGNDVLILAQFAARPAWDLQLANVKDTVTYFADEYRRDPDFRQRVDASALRILQRKAALYPEGWTPESVAPPDGLQVGSADAAAVSREVSRAALTRLRGEDLEAPLPGEKILVISDDVGTLACPRATCGLPEQYQRLLDTSDTLVDGLLLESFGPAGTGRIARADVATMTFCELQVAMLPEGFESSGTVGVDGSSGGSGGPGDSDGPGDSGSTGDATAGDSQSPGEAPVGGSENRGEPPADESIGGVTSSRPAGTESADEATGRVPGGEIPFSIQPPAACPQEVDRAAALARLREAAWIIFAITELNPTAVDHSQAVEAFLQIAGALTQAHQVRLGAFSFGPPYAFEATDFNKLDLFLTAYSKSPASVEAVVDAFFRELEATGAPPVSVEAASYDLASVLEPNPNENLDVELIAPADPSSVDLPAEFEVRVGPVRDHNGHIVPDGTVVEIVLEDQKGIPVGQRFVAVTADGIALVAGHTRDGGRLRLRAESGAASSEPLGVAFPEPTPAPRDPTREAAPAAEIDAPAVDLESAAATLNLADFLMCMASIVLVTSVWVAQPGWRRQSSDLRLRGMLLFAAGGLAAYVGYGGAVAVGSIERALAVIPHADAALVGGAGAVLAAGALLAARALKGKRTWPAPPERAR